MVGDVSTRQPRERNKEILASGLRLKRRKSLRRSPLARREAEGTYESHVRAQHSEFLDHKDLNAGRTRLLFLFLSFSSIGPDAQKRKGKRKLSSGPWIRKRK
jgi:hypothetical protein